MVDFRPAGMSQVRTLMERILKVLGFWNDFGCWADSVLTCVFGLGLILMLSGFVFLPVFLGWGWDGR